VRHIRDRKSNERLEESHLSALPSPEGGEMNILQQYQKAVKARDRRLGSALVVANKFLEVGQEHNFENGYSHEYQVGDMLTLCQGWADIEHSYGRAKVIRRVNHETVVIRRMS
jgi:hypothetical protein